MKKYILFDLDGTLTDSAPGIINSVKYTMKRLNIRDFDEKKLIKFVGPPLMESFGRFFGLYGESAERAIKIYREYFSEKGLFENEVYRGIPEALEAVRAQGLKTAVATSKPEVYSRRILTHFGLDKYFDEICGIPLGREDMTKAQVIKTALEKLGAANKSEALMTGDRSYDVLGAHENEIECLGVTYGYGGESELISAGAKYLADSPESMARLIINLSEK